MALTVTEEERRALEAAQAKSRAVRHWRRYQAVLLRADALPAAEVARVLRCTETSVCNWTAAWRADRGSGRPEGIHPGKARFLGPGAEAGPGQLPAAGDPQGACYAAPRRAGRLAVPALAAAPGESRR